MRVSGDHDERGSVALVTDWATLISAPGRGARGAGLEVFRKTFGSVINTSHGTVRMLAWQLRRGEGWRRCSCQRLSSAVRHGARLLYQRLASIAHAQGSGTTCVGCWTSRPA